MQVVCHKGYLRASDPAFKVKYYTSSYNYFI